jgi:hypothetical protein
MDGAVGGREIDFLPLPGKLASRLAAINGVGVTELSGDHYKQESFLYHEQEGATL